MTSYKVDNNRQVADRLPADFGQELAIAQDRKIARWVREHAGKFTWCPKCEVAIPTTKFLDHFASVHLDQA